jgi:hypothetical protein
MVLTTKHKLMLWVPTILYVVLMLGNLDREPAGGFVYRISMRGLVSSCLITAAALLITYGERKAFVAGIVFWLLALAALALRNTAVMIVHL